MLKRVLPIVLIIVLLFSSVAFAGGQGTGKASPKKSEPNAQLGVGFEGEQLPGYPCDREEWATFTYCYGYGYGYGYAYDCCLKDCTCTDGSCIYDCCTDGCCEFFYRHQWRWPDEVPDEPLEPVE